ncbi:MAG: hypothetical protein HND57_06175 [Planctomycetes bacterium]|nr:hypothetical protein [Planctomycetota bacterium]
MNDHSTRFGRLLVCSAALCIAGASTALGQAPPKFMLTDLGSLLGPESSAWCINDSGQVTGWSHGDTNQWNQWIEHAFIWDGGTMTDCGTIFGGKISFGNGINDAGLVVGNADYSKYDRAFLWDGATMVDLGTLGADPDADAQDINNSGLIVGTSRDGATDYKPVFWTPDGQIHHLDWFGTGTGWAGAVNNNDWIVGDDDNGRAVVWYPDGTAQDLGDLGDGWAYAWDVNDAGYIVGTSQPVDERNRGYIWYQGVMTDIGTLEDGSSNAIGINENNEVVGNIWTMTRVMGFYMAPDMTLYELNTVTTNLNGYDILWAQDINDASQIAAEGYDDLGNTRALLLTKYDLDLEGPFPGTSGMVNTVRASNAGPGQRVYFAYSMAPGAVNIPSCSGSTVLLSNPKVAGYRVADGTGTALLRATVPGSAKGLTFFIQAVQPNGCMVSNVVEHTFD